MATRKGGLLGGRWRTACGAAMLTTAAWTAASGAGTEWRAGGARADAADAEPPVLRSIAHAGGRFNGLAVDGDAVYIGEGPDVVALRVDANGQVALAHRTPLPDGVTSLAIAPEVDRLYASAGDGVYAIAIADGRPPTLIGGVALPLLQDSNIVARGDVVYAQIQLTAPGEVRCIVALDFGGTPPRGAVGPSVCATDVPAATLTQGNQLTLGDGVLAVYTVRDWGDGVPDVALFDVRDRDRPRFMRSMAFEDDVAEAVMAGHRLWVLNKAGMTVRSFDMSDPNAEPALIVHSPIEGWIERMFFAEGEIWLSDSNMYRAHHPNATSLLTPTKQRLILGCMGSVPPYAWVAATREVLLWLHGGRLWACRMPPDDGHITDEAASGYDGEGMIRLVAAAGGQSFAMGNGLTQYWHGWPAGLARVGAITLPPVVRGDGAADVAVGALDADSRRLVAVQGERLAAFDLPVAEHPVAAASWTIPVSIDGTDPNAWAVQVVGDRTVVLRGTDLDVVDLSRPDRPAARITNRWRSGRALSVGSEWAAVLAGGYVSDAVAREWVAPHLVLVDIKSSPPAVLGELTLSDRVGWHPVGVASLGSTLVMALTRRTGGTSTVPLADKSEVVVVDAANAAAPEVIGRAVIGGETNVQARVIAAAGSLAIVGGMLWPGRDPGAQPNWGRMQPGGRLWIVDMAVPEHPVVGASLAVPGQPSDIAVDGRAVLVAARDGGVQRFDLELPADVPAPAWRLTLPWLAPGERPVRGQPVPRRATALPRATTAP